MNERRTSDSEVLLGRLAAIENWEKLSKLLSGLEDEALMVPTVMDALSLSYDAARCAIDTPVRHLTPQRVSQLRDQLDQLQRSENS